MRSTETKRVAALALGVAVLAGCGSTGASTGSAEQQVPQIHLEGSRTHTFTSVDQMAKRASGIVVAEPTGQRFTKPLPKGNGGPDAAGTPYVRMKVVDVVSGSVSGKVIDVVSPGDDERSGTSAISGGGKFLMFLAPAMFAKNDPAGGYAVVGGPAGLYAAPKASSPKFAKTDVEGRTLPTSLRADATDLPRVQHSEAELLEEGP